VGIDHGGSDIIVAKKSLDGPDVVIGLEEMGGKAVAEGMGGDAFGEFGSSDGFVKGTLDMGLMQVIATQFPTRRGQGQRLLGKEPLPDKVLGRPGIFLFQEISEKDTGKSGGEILIMDAFDRFLSTWR
jgi:hypothetical protein